VRLYAEAGTGAVLISIFCNTGNNTGLGFDASISGYLVDVP
jgi:hypothetical protein